MSAVESVPILEAIDQYMQMESDPSQNARSSSAAFRDTLSLDRNCCSI